MTEFDNNFPFLWSLDIRFASKSVCSADVGRRNLNFQIIIYNLYSSIATDFPVEAEGKDGLVKITISQPS